MEVEKKGRHFVLVHGACHGSWSWYKLKPLLEAAGHRVTALDLAASGKDPKSLHELQSLSDYTSPLLDFMETTPADENVIMVGHSLGGLNTALAMEKYPNKIAVGVFLAAFMPDSIHKPSYVLDQYCKATPAEAWLDTKFQTFGPPEEPLTSMLFGPKFISSKLYQLCSPEDVELAKMLLRRSSLFREQLSKANAFTKEGYGSVKRVFIVCDEDKAIPEEFQRWQIEDIGVTEVKEVKGADHMAMLSKPQQLCQCLLEIAHTFTS